MGANPLCQFKLDARRKTVGWVGAGGDHGATGLTGCCGQGDESTEQQEKYLYSRHLGAL